DYGATVTTREPSLLYAMPVGEVRALMVDNASFAGRVAASFAADTPLRGEEGLAGPLSRRSGSGEALVRFDEARTIKPTREAIGCGPDTPLAEAARIMVERGIGSIFVVDPQRRPLGILTDTDLRRAVAEEIDAAATPVAARMSSPVFCVKPGLPLAELMATMLHHRVHHLAVTEGGTADQPVAGILSEHDLLRAQGHLPTLLLSQLDRASDAADLAAAMDAVEELTAEYLELGISMPFVRAVATTMNDRLCHRAIALAGDAPPGFCWLALGSEGRGEQLLRTDLDNALIVPDGADPAPYLAFAARVVALLHGAGFALCPGGIMADQPELCLPLHAWKARFTKLVETPTAAALLQASIYFDLRPVAGHLELGRALQEHLRAAAHRSPAFLAFFAHNALAHPPPLSFFRNFVVEKSGEHRDRFDVKARAMMPLADAARVLDLDPEWGPDAPPLTTGTVDRFRRLADPTRKALFEEAANAYDLLGRLRARTGLKAQNSGRYLPIAELTKLDRQSLRSVFAIVEDVQLVLSRRYQTDFIR
ncbi:MAG: DUF294 nucleotidyltransferase-like domain-containing protein, partial [Myxococcota bacterium]